MPNSFVGIQKYDDIRVVADGSLNDVPTLKIDQTPFLQVSMAGTKFSTIYDGFIGIAPYVDTRLARE